MNLRSFATPQPRPAPESWARVLVDLDDVEARAWWLVISVKPSCQGCDSVLRARAGATDPLRLLIVSEAPADEWSRGAPLRVDGVLMKDLGVSGAPYYVVVSPDGRIVGEGAVFSLEQVISETTPLVV